MLQYFIFTVFCLLKVSGGTPQNDSHYDVRLVGGEGSNQGRLEININGTWGTVCDDYFKVSAAKVVCRQLGYNATSARVLSKYRYRSGNQSIFLDDVSCYGDEPRLIDCVHRRPGSHDCSHDEDIGVECPLAGDYSLRLTDNHGLSNFSGRLEIKLLGQWKNICGILPKNAARVACRQMGFPSYYATAYTREVEPSYTFPYMQTSVRCTGNEDNISKCTFVYSHLISCSYTTGVSCQAEPDFEVRLVGGGTHDGRLEVKVGHLWGTVCDDNFGARDARVVCRQLGLANYGTVVAVSNRWKYGQADSTMPIWLDEVRCQGSESSLKDCVYNTLGITDCNHGEDVAIVCENATDIRFRLSGSSSRMSGRVEMSVQGEWGTVCDDGFTDNAAKVVCRELGLPYSNARKVSVSHVPSFSGEIWLDDVHCVGSETSLMNCQHRELGINDCSHSEDVGVHCLDSTSPVDIRLSGGFDTVSGRVEISVGGEWGTVCDDYFDNSAATVVCRQLGLPYLGARKISSSQFNEGTGVIWLDNVQCTGTEDNLLSCSHSNLGVSDCSHSEDVAVRCTDTTDVSDYSVRLRGGKDERSGTVEVFINGEWGTVCDDSFTNRAAKVVCRQLGYSDADAIVEDRSSYYSGNKRILLDDVTCSGYESSLQHCSHRDVGENDCSHSEDVAVSCEKKVNVAAIAGGIIGSLIGVVIIFFVIRHLKQKASEPSQRESTRTRGNVERSFRYTVSLQYNATSGTIQTRGSGSNGVIVPPTSPGLFAPPPSYDDLFPTGASGGEDPLRVPSGNPSTVGNPPTTINSPAVVTPTIGYN